MVRHHRRRAGRSPLAGDGHDHRLEPVMEARFVHEEYDGLLSGQGANHAPGEALAGFRHVDAGVGDETAQPGLHRVWDSQERQIARDGVEGAGFALATPKLKAARTAACGLDRFGNMLLIWLVQWRNGIGWRAGGSSLGLLFSPQGWGGVLARESTFSYTPPEKCKAVSIKGEGIRWLGFVLDLG